MQLSKIFLDASVILSGLASPSGGSRKLFEAAKLGKIKLITTPLVIEEVAHHLDKLTIKPAQLTNLLSTQVVSLTQNPKAEVIKKFSQVTSDPDDAHVLAAAVLSGANMLVSLDKKHIVTFSVRKVLKPILVYTPKELWKWLRKKTRP